MRIETLRQLKSLAKPFDVPSSPQIIDFRLSNICNLRCRTCGPGASSRWHSDALALGYPVEESAEKRSFNKDFCQQVEEVLENLERIELAGGEPLLSEEHYELLEMLISKGKTSVKLRYTTNLSVLGFGRWNILELWNKFDSVTVVASVDGAGDRGAFIRKGFDWVVFCANAAKIRQACPQVDLKFQITVSVFNILSITELLSTLEKECGAGQFSLLMHSLQQPVYYRTQVLPPDMKKEAARRIENYVAAAAPRQDDVTLRLLGFIDYMNAEDRSDELPNLRRTTGALDKLRNERAKAALPELSTIWENADSGLV